MLIIVIVKMTETANGNIDFNFTPEQQERFDNLWKETKKFILI